MLSVESLPGVLSVNNEAFQQETILTRGKLDCIIFFAYDWKMTLFVCVFLFSFFLSFFFFFLSFFIYLFYLFIYLIILLYDNYNKMKLTHANTYWWLKPSVIRKYSDTHMH